MKCACGIQTDLTPYFKDASSGAFFRCKHCHLVARQPAPTLEELREIYRSAYAEESIGTAETNQESGEFACAAYAKFLWPSLAKTDKVLDFGAGTGALVQALRQFGSNVEGVEFSELARAYSVKHRAIKLHDSTLDFKQGAFNVIVMVEVVEHVLDLSEMLEEVRRILKPDGFLFITTPNRHSLSALIHGASWKEAMKRFHLYLFSERALSFYLKRAGFKSIDRLAFSPVQNPGVFRLVRTRVLQLLRLYGTLAVVAR